MNHFRDLIEVVSTCSFTDPAPDGTAPEVLNEWARLTGIAGESAQCFWLGDIERALDYKVIPELCVLPYQVCWFEFAHDGPQGAAIVGLLTIQGESEFRAFTWVRQRDGWRIFTAYKGRSITDHALRAWAVNNGDAAEAGLPILATKCFLSALHCSNVRRQEHAPDAKLQKARAKRGKAPLFSYWTLQLDGKSERGEDLGGTHASPRVHLRRGHPRQYAPGKWTWVQAHAVGNRAAGVVHKDYSAGPALVAAAR